MYGMFFWLMILESVAKAEETKRQTTYRKNQRVLNALSDNQAVKDAMDGAYQALQPTPSEAIPTAPWDKFKKNKRKGDDQQNEFDDDKYM